MERPLAGTQIGRKMGLALIWFYQCFISALKPPCCRFQPTCSTYARDAVARFGLLRGGGLAVWRLLRCHPFYRGSLHDPVPGARTLGAKLRAGKTE